MNIVQSRQQIKKFFYVLILLSLFALNSGLVSSVQAQNTSLITRVSVASDGTQGNGDSYYPSVSGDGRYVAFASAATNFANIGSDIDPDVFVYDNQTSQIEIVSVNPQGNASYGQSPSISGNGRFVAFYSPVDLTGPYTGNILPAIYVRDLLTDQTSRATFGINGTNPNNRSNDPSISYDGRYVAFESTASNLVSNDTNGVEDIFVIDRQTGETRRVSVSSTGQQADSSSIQPKISADGRYVVYYSTATNLVPNDNNFYSDVFVHDLLTGETRRVSVSTDNVEGDADSFNPSISADGRLVVFSSSARNLTPDDPDNSTDIFLRDTQTGTTSWVSTLFPDVPGRSDISTDPEISSDGRFIAYASHPCFFYTNCNYTNHIYLYDRTTGTTSLVSTSDSGEEGNDDSGVFGLSISSDGNFVAYESRATNLVPNDTNEVRDVFLNNRSGGVEPTFTPTDTPTSTPTATATPTSTPTATLPPLNCTPNDLNPRQWDMRVIKLAEALNQFPNCQVPFIQIAVIDTGIDMTHPELSGRILSTETAVGNTAKDRNGHGTHVAGIIGAIQNNGIGIAGIHPNPQLYIYKYSDKWNDDILNFYEKVQRGGKNDVEIVADFIIKAVDQGARVINISLGNSPFDLEQPLIQGQYPTKCYPQNTPNFSCNGILENAIKYAQQHQPYPVIIVAAAGQTQNGVPGFDGYRYPAAYAKTYSNVITVASSRPTNEVGYYNITGEYITIAAPGGADIGCDPGRIDCILSLWLRGGYKEMEGTSMATPHVTGVVGLMLSANDSLTPLQVRDILRCTTTQFAINPTRQSGAGIVNAERAVQAAFGRDAQCIITPP